MKVGMPLVTSMVSTFGLNKKQRLLRRHYSSLQGLVSNPLFKV